MANPDISTETNDGVLTVTLNRPDKLNAITPAMHMELHRVFDGFAADDSEHVCVVKGAGDRAFCAGSDLGAFSADGGDPYPPSGYAGLAERYDLTKPVIAAVDGICLGGGLELALSCDMIIATPKAVFGLPEPKVGLIAIGGGIHRLVRQVGLKQAIGPLLTGANISAEEALRIGIASELVEADALDARIAELCGQIVANAPLAVRLTKELAMWGLDQPTLADANSGQVDHPSFQRWMRSEDAREGPANFVAKQPQNWKGR